MDAFQLTGQTDSHVSSTDDPHVRMHPETFQAFKRMRDAAACDGIRLQTVSAFRDFQRQLGIWNAKWNGERALYDAQGHPVEHDVLSPGDLMHTILTWSALPGASRHHWGTDLDIIDAAALPDGYTVQLLPREFLPGGPFHRMHNWLENHLGDFDFFFPYKTRRDGVSPEPWHISYAPVAAPALKKLTPDLLHSVLRKTDIEGKDLLLTHLPQIHQRYILGIDGAV